MCETADLRLTLRTQAASTPGTDVFFIIGCYCGDGRTLPHDPALAPNVHYFVSLDQTLPTLDKDRNT